MTRALAYRQLFRTAQMQLLPVLLLALLPQAAGEVVVACPDDVARCVRVGLTVPETGWASTQGLSAKRGAELWADAVNSDGGLTVADGSMFVELTVYDDGSSSSNTAVLYEQLISTDGVDFLLGPYGTSFSARAAAVAAEHEKVLFLGNAAGDSAYEPQARAAVTCVGVATGTDGVDCPDACTFVAAIDQADATCSGTAAEAGSSGSTDCTTFTADQTDCGDASGCTLTAAVDQADAHCGADVAGMEPPAWPHVFGVVTTSEAYTSPTAQMLHSLGAQTAAVLSRSDNGFTRDTAAGARAAFAVTDAAGTGATLDVAASATFAGDSEDTSTGTTGEAWQASIDSGMATACAAGADTLWLFGLKGDANALLQAMAALREECQPKAVYINSGPTESGWVAAANELEDTHGRSNLADLYHLLSAAQWVEPATGVSGPADALFGSTGGFRFRMESFYDDVEVGDDIHHHAASAAAAGIVLGEAIRVASQAAGATLDADGLPTQEAVGTAASNLDLSTFYGEIRFDDKGRNVAKGTVTTQIQSGSIVPVAPAEHAVSLLALLLLLPPPQLLLPPLPPLLHFGNDSHGTCCDPLL